MDMLNSLRSRWNLSRLSTRPVATVPSSTLPPRRSTNLRQAATVATEVLPAARAAFESALADLQGEGLDTQRAAIRRACSMQDLWHIRTGLYGEIARQISQSEAEQRLVALQGFFELS